MKTLTIATLCFLLIHELSFAQIESKGGHISGFEVTSWYEISVDSQILQSLTEYKPSKDEPFQFAFPVPVDLTPENSGSIVQYQDEVIWTVGIRSKSAKSINLILSPFHIPDSSYIYVYDSKRTTVRGAFKSNNNNRHDILPIMPVPGEDIILEYHIPVGVYWKGTLGISQVAHDYLGIFSSKTKDDRYNLSQPCNVDINCPDGAEWAQEKNAVCRIIIGGIELCTGVMVNNTNQQNIPFLLTAQHCIMDDNDASRSLFLFGYESPWCDGPDGRVLHSISGSDLLSTYEIIDFSLVELSSFPPFTYHPYLAGWDVSAVIPQRTVTIHHPAGDVKKITIDIDQPVTGTYPGYSTDGFWQILQWDLGTTEQGSSGSPLFDENHRVIGLLTGGEAVCGRSVNDYFAKLAVSYSLSPVLNRQLKGWIDNALTGIKKLDGRDPYLPNLSTVDTVTNILPGEQTEVTPYPVTGNGYSTGYNSDSLVMYAEYFSNPDTKEISEVILNIAKAKAVLIYDSVKVYVFNDGPVPGQIIASQKIFINEAKDQFQLRIDFKNTVPVAGNFYIGWQIWYRSAAISETRQFAVFHSPDRISPGLNTAWFNDGTVWKQFTDHPFAPMATSLDVKVILIGNSVVDVINNPREETPDFVIYPNPARDYLIISSKKVFSEIRVDIIDSKGWNILNNVFINEFPGDKYLDVSWLSTGLYYVNLISGNKKEAHKFIIIR